MSFRDIVDNYIKSVRTISDTDTDSEEYEPDQNDDFEDLDHLYESSSDEINIDNEDDDNSFDEYYFSDSSDEDDDENDDEDDDEDDDQDQNEASESEDEEVDNFIDSRDEDYMDLSYYISDDEEIKEIMKKPTNKWTPNEKSVYILNEQDPTSLHIFSNKPYYYLSDYQTEFTPDFEIINNDTITYYLYLYIVCNNTNYDPYLSCVLQYNEKSESYTFPKITYNPYNLNDDETHDVYIQNMCYDIIYPLFDIEETQVTEEFIDYTKDCFKGSLYYEGMKHGYIGFNVEKFIHYLRGQSQNLSQHFHKDQSIPKYTWVCLDEIRNKRVYNVSIDSVVIDTFEENKWLCEIKNSKDEVTDVPKMLYSCILKKNKIETTMADADKKKLLPPVTDHKELGRLRYFVDELNEDDYKNAFKMPRYIVFLGDVKVIDNIEKEGDIVNAFQKEKMRVTSIQFKKEKRNMYGVFNGECIFKF